MTAIVAIVAGFGLGMVFAWSALRRQLAVADYAEEASRERIKAELKAICLHRPQYVVTDVEDVLRR